MRNVKITTDSSCDLTPEVTARLDIDVVPIEVTLDGQTYLREYLDITPEQFYAELQQKDLYPKTSQPSPQTFLDAMLRASDNGTREVLHLGLTSKFSGSYQGALLARDSVMEQLPNAQEIRVIDTLQCTASLGRLVVSAAEMSAEGMSLDEITEVCEKLLSSSQIYCSVNDFEFLRKGGRIGKASSLVGGLLNIKPLIHFRDGELHPAGKVRGRGKVIDELTARTAQDIAEKEDDHFLYVMHGDCRPDAEEVARQLREKINRPDKDIPISHLGTVIGSHIGPTAIAMGYMLDWRKLV